MGFLCIKAHVIWVPTVNDNRTILVVIEKILSSTNLWAGMGGKYGHDVKTITHWSNQKQSGQSGFRINYHPYIQSGFLRNYHPYILARPLRRVHISRNPDNSMVQMLKNIGIMHFWHTTKMWGLHWFSATGRISASALFSNSDIILPTCANCFSKQQKWGKQNVMWSRNEKIRVVPKKTQTIVSDLPLSDLRGLGVTSEHGDQP